MLLDILIVTYNRPTLLHRAIEVYDADYQWIRKIWIWNNGSCLKLPDSRNRIEVRGTGENLGSAGGFSHLMREAVRDGARALALFNDDSYPTKSFYEIVARNAHLLKEGHFIKPIHKPPGNSVLTSHWDGTNSTRLVSATVGEAVRTGYVTFDGAVVCSSTVETIGLPYSEFFMGMYEIEYQQLRAARSGFYSYLLNEHGVVDAKFGSIGMPPKRCYYNVRNGVFCAKKYGTALSLARALFRCPRLILHLVRKQLLTSGHVIAITRAVVDGWRGRLAKSPDY